MTTTPTPQPFTDRLLNVHQIAEVMHADEQTVYRRIRAGKLKAFREGGRWLIWLSDLLRYLGKPLDGGQNA